MHSILLAALLAASPLSSSATSGLGGISLGMPQQQLVALGFTPGKIPGWFSKDHLAARVDAGAVVAVDYELTAAEAEAFTGKQSPSLEDLAFAHGHCGPVQVNLGANVVACDGSLKLLQHLGGFTLRLEKDAPAPQQRCDAYLARQSMDILFGKNVCLGSRVLTSRTTLESVEKDASWGACETVRSGDAATRRCRGTHLVFNAARLLARVEFH